MTQSVQAPLLSETSQDREINCEVALEAAFGELVAAALAQGWTPQETAAALVNIAAEHAQKVDELVVDASPAHTA